MRKKYKVKPSLPRNDYTYYTLLDDNCWQCDNKHNCNNCYAARIHNEQKSRRQLKKERQRNYLMENIENI